MGYGSYRASDWAALRKEKKLSQDSFAEQIFSKMPQSSCAVRNISVREARDPADTVCSTPLIIGFDVTASMGYLAKELAVHGLDHTIRRILEEQPVRSPQILCAAIGDSKCDRTPLQVTQFESDIRMIRQLTDLYLEGGGGGNGGESYHLLWYFAAYHTVTDSFEKRGEKGCLLTIGDDSCHRILTAHEIQKVFGDTVPYDLSSEELLRQVQQKCHVFHIHIVRDSSSDREIFEVWRNLMQGQITIIRKKDVPYLADLICCIIGVASGMSSSAVLNRLDQSISKRLAPSMALIRPAGNTEKRLMY